MFFNQEKLINKYYQQICSKLNICTIRTFFTINESKRSIRPDEFEKKRRKNTRKNHRHSREFRYDR